MICRALDYDDHVAQCFDEPSPVPIPAAAIELVAALLLDLVDDDDQQEAAQ